MSLTVVTGKDAARINATAAIPTFDKATQRYGRLLESYRADAPKGLALAHLVNVNPALLDTPPILRDQRRGFMKASSVMARDAEIEWEQLDDPLTCAYVWGRDINSDSLSLYTNNPETFLLANRDFWSTAYLKHRLGDAVFNYFWSIRDINESSVFDSILYSVSNTKKSVLGIPVTHLKKIALLDCQFVVTLATKAGSLSSIGFGIQPVLNESNMKQVF